MNLRSDRVMFGILLIASMFTQGLTMVSYGKDFVTAFPENLGYFFPLSSIRQLRITGLENDTKFNVFFNNTQKSSYLHSGETSLVEFPKTAEVYQQGLSPNSIHITSDKNIVVHSVSKINTTSGENVQTNVVQPIDNLGKNYLISSQNQLDSGTPASQRYGSFKLIIINAEKADNTVTVVKSTSGNVQETQQFTIPQDQLIQLQANASLLKVESSHKVAVLWTHPCLENSTSCKCNMIVNQILPTQGQNFVVPLFSDIPQSCLLMTLDDMSTSISCDNNQLQPISAEGWSFSVQTKSQYIKESRSASLTLISPGVFIELIPENMFAACYLLHMYSNSSSIRKAVVIAETGSKDKVHTLNGAGIPVSAWTVIGDSKYSSAEVVLTGSATVIWHPSSKIAVYILEKTGTLVYGGPAIPLNDKPDEFGCVVIPGEYEVRGEHLSWAESLAHCTSLQKFLACPTREDIQMDLTEEVNTTENQEAWIGLRRSLLTTDWYWLRQTPSATPLPSSSVDYVHWAEGHPHESFNGLCASLSQDNNNEFKWKSAKCCEKKRPVCYKPPIYFYLTFNPSDPPPFLIF